MAASTTAVATQKDSSLDLSDRTESEGFTTLVSRLGEDVMQLFDVKLNLLKVEIKEDVNAYVRGMIAIAVAGIIAAVGFALLNVAIAFGVSTLFTNTNLSEPARYALGFVVTGVFYLVVGGVVALIVKGRMANQDLVPNKTVEELRKDKQWLKNEL